MTEFTVPLFALRQALVAVRAHADAKSETLNVVRLIPGRDLLVTATDRYSAAIARVQIDDHGDGGADFIDVMLDDVAKILAVFKLPSGPEAGQAAVTIRRHGNELTLADGGGLFEGQALTVPAFAVDSMPDVRSLAGPALRARPLLPDPDGEVEYGHSNRNLAKLATATKVYGHTAFAYLCAWRTPAWVVTVGPDFLAVITSVRTGEVEDDAPESPEAWRDEWRRTLPGFGDVLRTGFGVLLPEDVAEALDELDDEDGER